MSNRTPPKSKMTARGLVAGATSAGRRRLRPLGGPVARERHPALLLHARLVEHAVLLRRARVAIALELFGRVVRGRLVPLPVPLGAAADQNARHDHEEEPPLPDHGRHGTMPPSAMLAVSYTHLRAHETPEHLVCRLLL